MSERERERENVREYACVRVVDRILVWQYDL